MSTASGFDTADILAEDLEFDVAFASSHIEPFLGSATVASSTRLADPACGTTPDAFSIYFAAGLFQQGISGAAMRDARVRSAGQTPREQLRLERPRYHAEETSVGAQSILQVGKVVVGLRRLIPYRRRGGGRRRSP